MSSYDELVIQELRVNGSLSLAALVERVAEAAMLQEQRRGAWVTDIGLWGPALYRREALATVRGMLGHSLALEGDGDGPWLAVPVEPGGSRTTAALPGPSRRGPGGPSARTVRALPFRA